VLIIASAGWIFDVYEGQIYNTTRDDMLGQLITADTPEAKQKAVTLYKDVFLGVFLAGGMVGGLLFGILGDRWGRRPTMIVTILMYSIFSGLTYFATDLWQVGVLRFLVSMGIGGEWAVAAAMVSEVFPPHARAQAGGIFHASSTLGTWLAALTAMWVGTHWRYAYLVGVLPALLILWVRAGIEEPETWTKAEHEPAIKKGSVTELFGNVRWRGRAIVGMLLAAVGLATYWGVTIEGQQLATIFAERAGMSTPEAKHEAKFAYGIIQATGGGLGLIAFGPFCQWLGRKRAFLIAHLLAFAIVPITCFLPQDYTQLLCILPFFGALTFGMHAGYAIYFPELFPASLRALGTSVCFNGGRIIAAIMLPLSGFVKGIGGMQLQTALTILASTYLLGVVLILFLPETKNQPLPE
jgi:MFS family permease